MKAFYTILLFLFLPFVGCYAQKDSLSNLRERISKIESQISTYKENINEKFDIKSEALNNQLEMAKLTIEKKLSILEILGGVISLILFLGLGALLWQYFIGMKKLADKILQEKLQHHLEENIESIKQLITSQKQEYQIRKNKIIKVLSPSQESEDILKKYVEKMGFKKIDFIVVDKVVSLKDADLLIFNNSKGDFSEQLIIDYLADGQNEDDVFIYFGTKRLETKFEHAEKINYANTKFTLYHQIINTLSFKDIMKEFQRN